LKYYTSIRGVDWRGERNFLISYDNGRTRDRRSEVHHFTISEPMLKHQW